MCLSLGLGDVYNSQEYDAFKARHAKAAVPQADFPTDYAKPVHIGSDVWLGANVVVCPGVTIGDGCVIGAGAVVTRDIPPRTFAAGNPCRVIREITEQDSMAHKPEILADFTVPQSFEGLY